MVVDPKMLLQSKQFFRTKKNKIIFLKQGKQQGLLLALAVLVTNQISRVATKR